MAIFTEPVCLSAVGAFCVPLLGLLELRTIPVAKRPNFKDIAYYLPFIIYPFFGAFIGYGYFHDSANPVNALMAIHIGISAPVIIRSAATVIPKIF